MQQHEILTSSMAVAADAAGNARWCRVVRLPDVLRGNARRGGGDDVLMD
jgi:hypothetical protein